ncbi:protein C1orf43 homolog isoform X1 [Anoplopoma fimbria]|uniref:protein C1orf43 homolog isoform X1 n=2 Tax=Anoplopoma fimbria TaxID=229290 RepID=UPI0023EA8546|nr:protein C1orf43 homolog isoform X1 [Anoplopoma fimbria]XP_054477365.1 protein C1orf43 homolog isoform X1 [Anoplopoma fimbria]
MRSESLLSSINVVLVMAYGSLVFVLLFIFVKRQIMRFAVKSRRGPHVPLGHNAPKELRQEIEAKLCHVQKIHFEPRLLSPDDDRLKQRERCGSHDNLYRMRALDAVRDTDLPFRELGGTSTAVTGKRLRTWLLQLRNSHFVFQDSLSSLIDTVLDGYNKARHGAETFGEAEFLKYQEALTELASVVKSHSVSSSPSQYHQSAAKDLTSTTEPASSSSSPTQTTYLTSSMQQRSKRPRHFLELKNFKDNYNTLDSSF